MTKKRTKPPKVVRKFTKNNLIIDKKIDKDSVQTAKEFILYLKQKTKVWNKARDIIKNLMENLRTIKDIRYRLVIFADEDYNLCYDDDINIIEILESLSYCFTNIQYSIAELPLLESLSEIFYEFSQFFMEFIYKDEITLEEIEKLTNISYAIDDINEFIETVFITKSATDIYIFEKLLKADLQQLEQDIHSLSNEEDGGELDFF
jgi:hypothetical protein